MRSLLERWLIVNEISFGFLFVPVAESAYKLGEIDRGDEALARGRAACLRAANLILELDERNGPESLETLAGSLEALQIALTELAQKTRDVLGEHPLTTETENTARKLELHAGELVRKLAAGQT